MGLVTGLITNQKREAGGGGVPGPPFALNSADNGLSVDPVSRRIVLGQPDGTGAGGPADLLDPREIPVTNANYLALRNYPAGAVTLLLGTQIFMNQAGGIALMTAAVATIQNTGTGEAIRMTPDTFSLTQGAGVASNTQTKDNIILDDPAAGNTATLQAAALQLVAAGGDQLTAVANRINFTPAFGDVAGLTAIGGGLRIEDVTTNVGAALIGQFFSQLGDVDNLHPLNNVTATVDCNNGSFYVRGPNKGFAVQFAAAIPSVLLGDIDGTSNNTTLIVDDSVQRIYLQCNNGINIIQSGALAMLAYGNALPNGAAAAVGTLTNAPAAGNPTKWIPIIDGGVTRYIPAW